MLDTISERQLDQMCWKFVSSRNRFYRPDETAEACVDALDDPGAMARGHEHGYHAGMFIAYDDVIDTLYLQGVNVLGRANRFTRINRDAGNEFRLESKPNYYLACETDTRVLESDLYPAIESLDNAPYSVSEI